MSSCGPRPQEPDVVPDPPWSWHQQLSALASWLSSVGRWSAAGGDLKIRCWRGAAPRCLAPRWSRSCWSGGDPRAGGADNADGGLRRRCRWIPCRSNQDHHLGHVKRHLKGIKRPSDKLCSSSSSQGGTRITWQWDS